MRLEPAKGIIFVKQKELDLNEKKDFIVAGLKEPRYEVVSIGEDVSICAINDCVFFISSTEFQYNGTRYYAINENDVIGVERA